MAFVGVKMLGYTEKEVGHFTLRKWSKLYEYFKMFHDFETKKCLFNAKEDNEENSNEWFKDDER